MVGTKQQDPGTEDSQRDCRHAVRRGQAPSQQRKAVRASATTAPLTDSPHADPHNGRKTFSKKTLGTPGAEV